MKRLLQLKERLKEKEVQNISDKIIYSIIELEDRMTLKHEKDIIEFEEDKINNEEFSNRANENTMCFLKSVEDLIGEENCIKIYDNNFKGNNK